MKPCRLPIAFIILVFFSCNNQPSGSTVKDPTKIAGKDTTGAGSDSDLPTKYVEHARLEVKDQVITLTTRYAVVDGKVDEKTRFAPSSSYFVYINKKTGKADTLAADQLDLIGCETCKYMLRDMTDSFQSKDLVVQVVTPALDIYYTNSFIGCRDGKFQQFFSIDDTREEGIELHREGSKLIGNTSGRDEVVDNLEYDYPVEIDVKTFKVTNIRPVKQYIGWATKATESFRAHRIIGGQVDSSLVTVNADTEVTVDTLYRESGKVRLHMADSVIVEIKVETARKKLGHNNAG